MRWFRSDPSRLVNKTKFGNSCILHLVIRATFTLDLLSADDITLNRVRGDKLMSFLALTCVSTYRWLSYQHLTYSTDIFIWESRCIIKRFYCQHELEHDAFSKTLSDRCGRRNDSAFQWSVETASDDCFQLTSICALLRQHSETVKVSFSFHFLISLSCFTHSPLYFLLRCLIKLSLPQVRMRTLSFGRWIKQQNE